MIDKRIDIKGLICPYPVMKVRDALKKMESGQTLEAITDYESAVKTSIPKFCDKKGCPLEVKDNGDGSWTLLIKKKE